MLAAFMLPATLHLGKKSKLLVVWQVVGRGKFSRMWSGELEVGISDK